MRVRCWLIFAKVRGARARVATMRIRGMQIERNDESVMQESVMPLANCSPRSDFLTDAGQSPSCPGRRRAPRKRKRVSGRNRGNASVTGGRALSWHTQPHVDYTWYRSIAFQRDIASTASRYYSWLGFSRTRIRFLRPLARFSCRRAHWKNSRLQNPWAELQHECKQWDADNAARICK